MARKVGKQGRVLAVNIQREMLLKLRARGDKNSLNNVEPVPSTEVLEGMKSNMTAAEEIDQD